MIHKILSHGTGDPFAYLLRAEGRTTPPSVIRGDVTLCSRVIRGCTFAQRYTSLVLTFAELVSENTQHQIITEYEANAFAGHADEFARVWVRHEEHGRTELHCVVANVHLPTGKRWAHYYDRADRPLFHSWQEVTNARYGLSSPDDPRNRRLRDVPGKLPPEKRQLFERLDLLVCHAIVRGEIHKRDDIAVLLRAHGYAVRESQNHLAVKSAGDVGKALRLKGKKYVADFSIEAFARSSTSRCADDQAATLCEHETTLAAAMSRRAAYLAKIREPRRRRYAARAAAAELCHEKPTNHGVGSIARNRRVERESDRRAMFRNQATVCEHRAATRRLDLTVAAVGLKFALRRFICAVLRIRYRTSDVGFSYGRVFARRVRRGWHTRLLSRHVWPLGGRSAVPSVR